MILNVVVCSDNNYIQHCMGMLCSLYEHNKEHHIILHFLRNGELTEKNETFILNLTQKYGHEVRFYSIDESPLEGVQFRKKRPLTMAAYYRLLLPDILSHLDKVLYLDSDMTILGDISELFELELDKYALAACLDDMPHNNQHRLQLHMQVGERTFNTGMMLCNLKYWREHGSVERMIEYAKRPKKVILLHDQDVFNYEFQGQWFLLPPKWNRLSHLAECIDFDGFQSFDRYEYLNAPKIVHHFIKPWVDVYKPYQKLYLTYVEKSGYKPIVLQHVKMSERMLVYRDNVLYYLKRYIYPYVPKLLYLFFADVKYIIQSFVRFIKGKKIQRR